MARMGAKLSRSEASSILKNTFLGGIFWWNRPYTSFLGLIGYTVRLGAKLFRTKTFPNFASKSPLEFVFPKNTYSVWIFVLNRTTPIFLVKRTRWHDWAQSVPEWSFVHPKKHVFDWNFLMKPAPYLVSGPNWLYRAFGGKIVLDENFAQFCLKALSNSFFRKTNFRFEFLY